MDFDFDRFAASPWTHMGAGFLAADNVGQGIQQGLHGYGTYSNQRARFNESLLKMQKMTEDLKTRSAKFQMIDSLPVDDSTKAALKADPNFFSQFMQINAGLDVPSAGAQEWQLRKAREGRSTTQNVFAPQFTNNPNLNQSEYAEMMGKELAKQDVKVFGTADKARSSQVRLDQLDALLDIWSESEISGEPGALVPILNQIAGMAEQFGIDPSTLKLAEAGPGQAIEALTNQMALGKIGGEDGIPANNFSDADRKFVVSTVPRLSDTPDGFKLKTMVQRSLDMRAIEHEAFIMNNQDKSPMERRRLWSEYVNKPENRLFQRKTVNGVKYIKIGDTLVEE